MCNLINIHSSTYIHTYIYFRVFFVPFPFSLCMESKSYVFFLPDGAFLPCDHGLDFFT